MGIPCNLNAARSVLPAAAPVADILLGRQRTFALPAATSTICCPATAQRDQYAVHPAALDAATQAGASLAKEEGSSTRVPVGIAAYRSPAIATGASRWNATAALQGQLSDGSVLCGYSLLAESGNLSAVISGMQFMPVGRNEPHKTTSSYHSPNYAVGWEAAEPLIQSAIDGSNVCVFAYGQTGSGKTHTMLGTPESQGIIFRAVDKIFEAKKMMEDRPSNWAVT